MGIAKALQCVSFVILNHHRKSNSDAPFILWCVSFEFGSLQQKSPYLTHPTSLSYQLPITNYQSVPHIKSVSIGITAYSRFMNYTPETGFLYSYRIITDSIQETRFLCAKHTWNMLYLSLCSLTLCSLRFNHSNPTGIDITHWRIAILLIFISISVTAELSKGLENQYP